MFSSQHASVDPFAVLGIAPGAAEAEIKAAYRRLAKACHPDAAPGDAAAARRFQDITAAYHSILKGEPRTERRSERRAPRRRPKNGADQRVHVSISMEEAVAGGSFRLEFASGERAIARFPVGCEDRAVLRLKGWGRRGRDGGRAGDALVEVRIKPHELFRIEGADAHLLFKTNPRRLARGGVVEAPTPCGPVSLTIPPAARPGMVLRVKGKGIPERAGRPAGDLYVTLKVGDSTGPIRMNGG